MSIKGVITMNYKVQETQYLTPINNNVYVRSFLGINTYDRFMWNQRVHILAHLKYLCSKKAKFI